MLLLDPGWRTNPTLLPPAPVTSMGMLGQAQLIVLVTTHEILHQWFGDTVTMRGYAEKDGVRIGFGEVSGIILPAVE